MLSGWAIQNIRQPFLRPARWQSWQRETQGAIKHPGEQRIGSTRRTVTLAPTTAQTAREKAREITYLVSQVLKDKQLQLI